MLNGTRVTLRALTKADMPTLLRYSLDVEVELLSGGDPPRPCSLEGWEKWYEEHVAKDNKDSANFGIEADGKLVGTCGVWRFNTHSQTCYFGISIGDHEYWGRGFGRDAIALLLDYAFRLRNFRKVCLDTSSNNERAIRCYRACGFVEEGRLRQQLWVGGQYVDEVHMGLLREEWSGQSAPKG
jgi:RimJ/RimL family protein N-acetyltransferase